MKLSKVVLLFTMLVSAQAFADGQCGPFRLSAGPGDGLMHINGAKPLSQKVTFLKKKEDYDNVMFQWMVEDPKTGQLLGIEYVKRAGKAILNAEAVRANMDAPRVFGTYDCVKVK
ncbi:hypothetical protein SM12BL1_39200 [Serratia marcescens]|nr:hypothetical protein [Serratia marcescens]CUZ95850.1 Uncharacterised protein [Serratia marcescens]CVA64596.1 Uncharacterised protein [Serratia marcescens]CVB75349.1 Uncharacterised protein [Serratia marcescens]CVC59180.1 Uncharacterised protein [Serratia marcescens]CVD57647.1 Uncharacterised protein [Serratia marcescens]